MCRDSFVCTLLGGRIQRSVFLRCLIFFTVTLMNYCLSLHTCIHAHAQEVLRRQTLKTFMKYRCQNVKSYQQWAELVHEVRSQSRGHIILAMLLPSSSTLSSLYRLSRKIGKEPKPNRLVCGLPWFCRYLHPRRAILISPPPKPL